MCSEEIQYSIGKGKCNINISKAFKNNIEGYIIMINSIRKGISIPNELIHKRSMNLIRH